MDEPRPDRPRTIPDQDVERVITATLESTPCTRSTRSMAAHAGLSQTAVSRIWRAFGLAPHRRDSGSCPPTWPVHLVLDNASTPPRRQRSRSGSADDSGH